MQTTLLDQQTELACEKEVNIFIFFETSIFSFSHHVY